MMRSLRPLAAAALAMVMAGGPGCHGRIHGLGEQARGKVPHGMVDRTTSLVGSISGPIRDAVTFDYRRVHLVCAVFFSEATSRSNLGMMWIS